MTVEFLPRQHVGTDHHPLPRHHVRQLVFLEVGIDPQTAGRHHREQLRAGLGIGADPCPAIADHTVNRCLQFGVADIQLRQVALSLGLDQGGPGLLFLGVDHIQLALRGQQFSLGAVALGLGRLERGIGPLGTFNRDGVGDHQFFVAGIVIPRTDGFGTGGVDAGTGLADDGLLQLLGGVEVGEQGLLGGHCAFGLGQVGAVVAGIETDQHVAGLDLLVVGHQHFIDVARHFRPDHRYIAADVGVVGFLDETSGSPPMRAIHTGQHQCRDAQCWQQQAFEQGRFGDSHRGSQVGFNGGHAGHGGLPVGAAVNYDDHNMTNVIFCGKWFLLPVVRWFVQREWDFICAREPLWERACSR
ncbi:hypothetical protein D3C80_1115460 [compost metagenome]